MLLSHIEHYLNSEGIKAFPAWYAELKNLFLNQDGFINIKYAHDPVDSGCIHIWTEFTNIEQANIWAQSQMKIDIQAHLDPMRTKPMLVERFELVDY